MNHIKKFILLSFVALVGLTSCSDDDPIVPDYTTYQFENSLTGQEEDLVNSNGYAFTVVLNRSTATQEDVINLQLTDANGKFGFDNGQSTTSVTFGVNESSMVINVKPLDASMISIFETYDVMVSMVVPAGTPSQSGYSVDVTAMPVVNWVSEGQQNWQFGWSLAAAAFGSTSKDIDVEKDSNVAYYKYKEVFPEGNDIFFSIDDNGEVTFEDQEIFTTDPLVFGQAVLLTMKVNSAVYDAGANTVTLNYDMVLPGGATFSIPSTDITDVITLP